MVLQVPEGKEKTWKCLGHWSLWWNYHFTLNCNTGKLWKELLEMSPWFQLSDWLDKETNGILRNAVLCCIYGGTIWWHYHIGREGKKDKKLSSKIFLFVVCGLRDLTFWHDGLYYSVSQNKPFLQYVTSCQIFCNTNERKKINIENWHSEEGLVVVN